LSSTATGKRILAVASGDGHWAQLMRLMPVFAGHDCAFVSTTLAARSGVSGHRYHRVPDAKRWGRLLSPLTLAGVLAVMVRERPQVVISTGGVPGVVAVALGKWMGAKTIWVDSIDEAESISRAGRLAKGSADLLVTQWPHLAGERARYYGAVL
jgi:hypothetical protein